MNTQNLPKPSSHLFEIMSYRFQFQSDTGDIVPESTGIDTSPTCELLDLPETPLLRPTRAISLAVAQRCNLACTYCYAQGGQFGQKARLMDKTVAFAGIEQLLENTPEGERVNIAYMGGEPMLNANLIHDATHYAFAKGRQRNIAVGFSLTTNGSLLAPQDIELFKCYGFAITISLDGSPQQHDAQRRLVSGKPSYERIVSKLKPLLDNQLGLDLSARVTVTPKNLDLPLALNSLSQLGFHDIGFSPMINAPTHSNELSTSNLKQYLDQMIKCTDEAVEQIINGKRPVFSNLTTALNEIHSGKVKTHPCGAGNGYVGIGADANVYLCHRYINDDKGYMGDLLSGIETKNQQSFVIDHSVDAQATCASCWARRLCGGGCYHEVEYRGRPTCDFIRGWLDHCLKAYIKVRMLAPRYFDASCKDAT